MLVGRGDRRFDDLRVTFVVVDMGCRDTVDSVIFRRVDCQAFVRAALHVGSPAIAASALVVMIGTMFFFECRSDPAWSDP